VIADVPILRRTAIGLAIAALLLVGSGGAIVLGIGWSCTAALLAILVFVAGGFWGNYAVFGEFRRNHIVANLVIALIVIAFLCIGCVPGS
jgi:hypothetical protein